MFSLLFDIFIYEDGFLYRFIEIDKRMLMLYSYLMGYFEVMYGEIRIICMNYMNFIDMTVGG